MIVILVRTLSLKLNKKKLFFILSLPLFSFCLSLNLLAQDNNPKVKDINLAEEIYIENSVYFLQNYTDRMYGEQIGLLTYINKSPHPWNARKDEIAMKVKSNGSYQDFFGDTVVFSLNEDSLKKITSVVDKLDQSIVRMPFLSEKLEEKNIHLTLHDLISGNIKERVHEEMAQSKDQEKIQVIFKRLREYLEEDINQDKRYVNLKSANMYPSSFKSLVLGFVPADEKSFRILFNTYKLFDELKPLSYFLRPHITLRYFKPQELSQENLNDLCNFLNSFNEQNYKNPIYIRLDLLDLVYQEFFSMNKYKTLSSVSGSDLDSVSNSNSNSNSNANFELINR